MKPSNVSLENLAALGEWAKSKSIDQQLYLLSLFRQGGPLDFQRQNGAFNPAYVDFATIAIGITADAMHWKADATLDLENDYAALKSHFGNVPMSTIWPSLPQRNVYNTFMGYNLYDTGAVKGH